MRMYILNHISHASPRRQPVHPRQLPSIIFLFQYKGRVINSFFKSSALMTNIYYISLSSKSDVSAQSPTEVLQGLSVHRTQGAGALGMPRDTHIEAVMQVREPLLLLTAAPQCLRREESNVSAAPQLLPDGFITAQQDLGVPAGASSSINHHRRSHRKGDLLLGDYCRGLNLLLHPRHKHYPFLTGSLPSTSARH